MDSNHASSDEPRITLADLKSALSLVLDKSKSELIADLGGLGDRSVAFSRDKWMCELGRYAAIENGLRLIRDLEAAANRLDGKKRRGGAA
jgi:hypothetical protein